MAWHLLLEQVQTDGGQQPLGFWLAAVPARARAWQPSATRPGASWLLLVSASERRPVPLRGLDPGQQPGQDGSHGAIRMLTAQPVGIEPLFPACEKPFDVPSAALKGEHFPGAPPPGRQGGDDQQPARKTRASQLALGLCPAPLSCPCACARPVLAALSGASPAVGRADRVCPAGRPAAARCASFEPDGPGSSSARRGAGLAHRKGARSRDESLRCHRPCARAGRAGAAHSR